MSFAGEGVLALAAIGAGAPGTRGDLATGIVVGGLLAGGGRYGRGYDRGYGRGYGCGGVSFAEGYLLGSRSCGPCGYGYGYGWGGSWGYGGPWGGYGGPWGGRW